MSISDNHPERRNLVVTAATFIVYYAAGGHIPDSTLRLSVVNISFTNPIVLAAAAWLLLCWFALRFWQSTRGAYFQALIAEMQKSIVLRPLHHYAVALARKRPEVARLLEDPRIVVQTQSLRWDGLRWVVTCVFLSKLPTSLEQHRNDEVELKGFVFRVYLTLEVFRHTITGNASSNYLAPYALFFGAIVAPLWSQWL